MSSGRDERLDFALDQQPDFLPDRVLQLLPDEKTPHYGQQQNPCGQDEHLDHEVCLLHGEQVNFLLDREKQKPVPDHLATFSSCPEKCILS